MPPHGTLREHFVSTHMKMSKNVIRHFLVNFGGRPGILSNRIPIRENPGTFAKILPKVAFRIFEKKFSDGAKHFQTWKCQKLLHATFGRIFAIVPRFFPIGFRFERIPGRSPKFVQKWRFKFLRKHFLTEQKIFGHENVKKKYTPLLGEFRRSSRDSFESDSDSKESRDVRQISSKSGASNFWKRISDRQKDLGNENVKNFYTPLLGEFWRSSQDYFESDSDSKESRDVCQNSSKTGVSNFWPARPVQWWNIWESRVRNWGCRIDFWKTNPR